MCDPNLIFVFGSNLEGRHGKGAAKRAVEYYGAIYGQGEGLQGRSYALPTKETPHHPLSLHRIKEHVDTFLLFAIENPKLNFFVTKVGCGLAGYEETDIIELFRFSYDVPSNVWLPEGW